MKLFIQYAFLALITLGFAACGEGAKNGNGALAEKNKKLEALKKQYVQLGIDIKQMETEIAKLDTNAASNDNARLVKIDTVRSEQFVHYIDLQGKVDAENTSYVTPRGMGGQVRAIFVKEGDYVKAGQILLKLDDVIVKQSYLAAKAGLNATRTQLALAKNLYQRQKNLWDQNIGTEIQLLQAKANMEALESNLSSQQENVKAAQEQLNTATVVSNVNGVADEVNIHVGETFTGAPQQGIKIVNKSKLKIVANIPENYLARVSKGVPVEISIPDIGKTYQSNITLVSQTINPQTGGFNVEAKLPGSKELKPNLTAMVRIQDYVKENAIAVPVNTLQTDESGKFVFVAVMEKDKLVARKRNIVVGELYGSNIEVTQGLQAGDVIVTEGYQNLYDGQTLNVAE